ncbi:interleukin-13 receptor subunit alpha-2 [Hippocampus zosterae]|uniref:interleukin-13 receptor subunit alpha-2 n=1 Tax=Hippocampus zosterae TaxID=109293 RepID=UPI00223E80F1|nr:interleukin-13 receptor subunit alpha-2 [Hippocampus zosterae]
MLPFKLGHGALLMVFSIIAMEELHCSAIQVDPPEEIKIIDPDHLGHLEITWTLPASLRKLKDCPKRYRVEYFNAYSQSWDIIQTPQRTYSAQFDLMKEIRVRVYTLLSGRCTNNTWIKSGNFTELVQKPPSSGRHGNAVKDFGCVFHNMEHMICKWRKHPTSPANSQLYMYYWHKELQKTEECPKYLFTNGDRSGCSFTGKALPDFTNVNFCVNGSSPEGPLRPTYKSLQIQNYVKPDATNKPILLPGDARINLRWRKPDGKVPGHCLEWEVDHTSDGPQNKSEPISTMHTSLTLPAVGKKNCFRVRSKMHKYCAAGSFWSEWSPQTCTIFEQNTTSDTEF